MIDLSSILQTSTILCGIAAFILIFTRNLRNGHENSLDCLLSAGIAGSSIPTGLILVYCAFSPATMQDLESLGVYVAFAGLALVFVALKSIMAQLSSTPL